MHGVPAGAPPMLPWRFPHFSVEASSRDQEVIRDLQNQLRVARSHAMELVLENQG